MGGIGRFPRRADSKVMRLPFPTSQKRDAGPEHPTLALRRMGHPVGLCCFGYFAAISTVEDAGWICVFSSWSCLGGELSALYLPVSGAQTWVR
jgi:hypothetical protein